MPRMHILTAAEQHAFDTPPVLSDAERDTFFLNVARKKPRSPCEPHKIRLTRDHVPTRACRSSFL